MRDINKAMVGPCYTIGGNGTPGASNEIARIYHCPADILRIDAISHRPVQFECNEYVPRLGDIMNTVQSRHIKLWFAGKARNWELATYELVLLKAGLLEAAVLYEGIPVSSVTTMAKPVDSVSAAIEARDGRRFAKAVGELTDGCNACHKSMGRGFIGMRMPSEQPFSDQSFAPEAKR